MQGRKLLATVMKMQAFRRSCYMTEKLRPQAEAGSRQCSCLYSYERRLHHHAIFAHATLCSCYRLVRLSARAQSATWYEHSADFAFSSYSTVSSVVAFVPKALNHALSAQHCGERESRRTLHCGFKVHQRTHRPKGACSAAAVSLGQTGIFLRRSSIPSPAGVLTYRLRSGTLVRTARVAF